MEATSTLTSLAMLKVNADVAGRDYVDYLVPFVTEALMVDKPNIITAEAVAKAVEDKFGLIVSRQGCELVLRRLAKKGQLKRVDHQYVLNGQLPVKDIQRKRNLLSLDLDLILDRAVEYCSHKSGVEWPKERVTSTFIYFLSRFSIESLRSYTNSTRLMPILSPSEKDLFLVASFVQDAQVQHPDLFQNIMTFVKGHMLANALVCQDLDSISEKFQGVAFYLDTPLVLSLLGLQGELFQSSTSELIGAIQKLRGLVYIFEHTAEEVDRVIKSAEGYLNSPAGRGRIITEMRRQNKTPTDLALVRANLEQHLKKFAVLKRSNPEYTINLQIDETLLESALDTEIDYLNPRAVQYDVNSIRSIYALRKGLEPTKIERAVAVLVTSNAALSRVAFEYGRNVESTYEVSSVITDFSLANLTWLKSPLELKDGLPRFELLSICYAALEPNEELWKLYVQEIDKLMTSGVITPDTHFFLRYSVRARKELMNLTMGVDEDFSEQTVQAVLEKVKSELVSQKDAELQEQKGRTELVAKQAAETARNLDIERQRITAGELRLGKILSNVLFWVQTVILWGGAGIAIVGSESVISSPIWVKAVVFIIIALAIIYGAINLTHGIAPRAIADRCGKLAANRLMHSLFSSPPSTDGADDSR